MKTRRIAILLWATILLGPLSAQAEDPVDIPDPALKAAVMEALGLTTDPTPTDMLGLSEFYPVGRGIADLTGLEYAVNLTFLSLQENQIADISVLSGLTSLTELTLNGNQISDVAPLAGLTNLTSLDISANQINDLGPLAGLTNLTFLSITWNQISDLSPLSGLTQLEHLAAYDMPIEDISPLAGLTNLVTLSIRGGSFGDISVLAGLTKLEFLGLAGNGISDLTPLAGLTNLTWLALDGNEITDISPLSDLTNLTYLALGSHHENISDITPLAGMTKLTELYVSGVVTDISPLAGLTNLTKLSLGYNEINDITPLAGLTNLTWLYLGENGEIADVSALEGLTKLTWLHVANNRVVDISPLSALTDLEELLLYGNEISDITPLAGLVKLRSINISDNQVTDISALAGLTNLTYVGASFNHIADISPLSTLADLVRLEAAGNEISDISALAGLANLGDIQLPINQISDISALSWLSDLDRLDLADNLITDVSALTGMTNSRELDLRGNPLHPKACVVDIPLIKANNPGIVIYYDGCVGLPQTLTVSSTLGGSVVMPGEDVFAYAWGELAPVEAVPDEGHQFTHWSGTAVDANAMLDPSAIHTSVILDADYSLVAHFKPQDKPWSVVYSNDFEAQVGPEWSREVTDVTPLRARRFLGRFNTDVVTLTLVDLPAHSDVRVSFDVFIIRSWDGDGLPAPPGVGAGVGPDLWSLDVTDGPTLLRTTFDNHDTQPYLGFHRQSYPFEHPYGESLPQTGAAEIGTLGYVWNHPDADPTPCDSVYHLDYEFTHSAEGLQLVFSASLTEPLNNESWGLDNVRVEVLEPEVDAELTVTSTAGGSVVVPGEGTFAYSLGESVPTEAAAEANYHFTHWSGSAVGAGKVADPAAASTTVAVDADCTLTANFAVDRKTLTVSSTAGGSATTPGEGTFQYELGESAPIQATAEANYHFTHWSGSAVDAGKVADPASASTTVAVDADYTLTANFAVDRKTLTVSSTAGGAVTTPGEGTFQYDLGESAPIQATAEANYHFTHWSGSAVDAGKVADPASASTTVAVDADYTLIANFAVDQKTLTVSSTAGGAVTTPGEGAVQYELGESAPIQATAEANYHFTHWSGSAVDAGKVADPTSASTTVAVDGDYTLVANFKIDQHRLTVSAAEGGYVTTTARVGTVNKMWPNDVSLLLDHGTEITVTAAPYAPWYFKCWSGTMGSSNSSLTFVLTADCSLQAVFEL